MDIQGIAASGPKNTARYYLFCSLILLVNILSSSSIATTVTLKPTSATIYESSVANFFCSVSKPIDTIVWTLNGTSLGHFGAENPKSTLGAAYGSLTFSGHSARYNNTIIRCTVMVSGSKEVISSDQAVIFVQGLLPPITNLKETYVNSNKTLLVSWDRPSAIAVPPETEPSIAYHVIINDGTSDRTITLTNITYFAVSNLDCKDAYVFTIRPTNIVGMSGHTVVQFPGMFEVQSQYETPHISEGNYVFEFLVLSGMVCDCSAFYLERSQSLRCVIATQGNQRLQIITDGHIPDNTRFSIELVASNRQHNKKYDIPNLSTFDVQEMFLSTSISGSFLPEISYKLQFMGNSLAVGALIMFLLKISDYDCQRSSFFLQNKESAERFNNFTQGLSDGSYVVRVYDVEGNGEISSMEPALRKTIIIRGSGSLSNPSGSCVVESIHNGASVQCSEHFQATSGYTVALIPSDTTGGTTGKFSVASTSSKTTPLEIQSERLGKHCVIVFPLLTRQLQESRPIYKREETLVFVQSTTTYEPSATIFLEALTSRHIEGPHKNSNDDMTIGLAVGLSLLFVITISVISSVILIFFIYKKKKRSLRGKNSNTESGTSSSQHSEISSKMEKISTRLGDKRKMSTKNNSDNSAEEIQQTLSNDSSHSSSTHSPKRKKIKNLDIFNHHSNQVAPATDYDTMMPGDGKSIEKRRKQHRSKSVGDALKKDKESHKGNQKKSRVKSFLTLFSSKPKPKPKPLKEEKNHKEETIQHRQRAKSIVEPKEPRKNKRAKSLGAGLMVQADIESVTGARPVSGRRKTLGEFSAAMHPTPGATTSGTGTNVTPLPNETTDSAATYLKQHRKSLPSPDIKSNNEKHRSRSLSRPPAINKSPRQDTQVLSPPGETLQRQNPRSPLPPLMNGSHPLSRAATGKTSVIALPPISNRIGQRDSSILYGSNTTTTSEGILD